MEFVVSPEASEPEMMPRISTGTANKSLMALITSALGFVAKIEQWSRECKSKLHLMLTPL
jgi:hypothetical protein